MPKHFTLKGNIHAISNFTGRRGGFETACLKRTRRTKGVGAGRGHGENWCERQSDFTVSTANSTVNNVIWKSGVTQCSGELPRALLREPQMNFPKLTEVNDALQPLIKGKHTLLISLILGTNLRGH